MCLIKLEILDVCQAAQEIGIAIDADGLLEDRAVVKSNNLQIEDSFLQDPDVYNMLTLKFQMKMEGYTMYVDKYILPLEA